MKLIGMLSAALMVPAAFFIAPKIAAPAVAPLFEYACSKPTSCPQGSNCPTGCTTKVTRGEIVQGESGCVVTISISVTCTSGESCGPEDRTVDCTSSGPISLTCGGCCFSVDPGGAEGCDSANWQGLAFSHRCACYVSNCSTGACP